MTLFGNKHKSEAGMQVQELAPKRLTLKDLVPNDEKMYLALQNFLLGDPERQLPMLGSTETLLARGDQDRAKGEKLKARMSYETAAKIEIYKQNRENVEKVIRLAKDVTDDRDPHLEFFDTMLANLDEVLRISREYSAQTAHRKV